MLTIKGQGGHDGPQDPPDPINFPDEQQALKSIVVHSFGANPRMAQPFGKTTVSWNVTIPLDAPAEITLKLDGKPVLPVGSQEFLVTGDHEYLLIASTEHRGRSLGRATVGMDASQCQLRRLDAALIVAAVKEAVSSAFLGQDQVKMRRDGTEVTLDISALLVHVPLEIEVPNWFNADMDINVELHVGGGSPVPAGRPVTVSTKSLTVSVDWTLFESILSFGCTDAVEAGMEHMAQPLLFHIVDYEIAPEIQRLFTDQLNKFLADLQAADLNRRKFGPASVWFDSNGLNMTACPLPAADPGPVVQSLS